MRKIERDVTANVRALVTELSGASNGGAAVHFPGATCVQTATPMLSFNSAYIESPTGIGNRSLQEIRAFYEGAPEWAVNVPGPMSDLFTDYQEKVKVSRCDTQWEMIMRKEEASFKRRPRDLEIERVDDVRRLRVWARTSAIGFEIRPNSFDCFVNGGELQMPGMAYFLGLKGGRPVSTSASFVSDGIAGVYFISTVPEARGHGYGEAVVAACVRSGLSKGCSVASLQCGTKGYPWYYRMGFRPLFYFERWVAAGRL